MYAACTTPAAQAQGALPRRDQHHRRGRGLPGAQSTAGALKSLSQLDLEYNRITDAGCATLVAALRGGALPALKTLELDENSAASEEAQEAVYASRPGLADGEDAETDAEEGE